MVSRLRLRACLAFLAAPACLASSACSNGDGGGTSQVSFVAQVEPIFQQSCALSASCHGDPFSAPIQPYLGSVDGGVAESTILASIVGVPAAEDPTMNLVSPGDPAQSFLMHKMDGDQGTLASACAGTSYSATYPNCGASMPSGAATLPAAMRDTVRAWIMQGAK